MGVELSSDVVHTSLEPSSGLTGCKFSDIGDYGSRGLRGEMISTMALSGLLFPGVF